MLLLLTLFAHAGELNMAPDRGGLGESTGTPGAGHAILAAGARVGFEPLSLATNTFTARVGIAPNWEARATLPDLTISEGESTLGPARLGAKLAGNVTGDWKISIVPELLFEPSGRGFGGYTAANLSWSTGLLQLWGHGSFTTFEGAVTARSGAGLGLGENGHTAYVHAMAGFAEASMVGGGGWIRIDDNVQVDLSCDVFLVDGDAYPTLLGGIAVGL